MFKVYRSRLDHVSLIPRPRPRPCPRRRGRASGIPRRENSATIDRDHRPTQRSSQDLASTRRCLRRRDERRHGVNTSSLNTSAGVTRERAVRDIFDGGITLSRRLQDRAVSRHSAANCAASLPRIRDSVNRPSSSDSIGAAMVSRVSDDVTQFRSPRCTYSQFRNPHLRPRFSRTDRSNWSPRCLSEEGQEED